ncbi:glycosyltransferase family 2 protein [Chitinophaga defluvii]|uniref:Glycosyltransferase family 2 protein n=1 Tax=Chitinophaga defluvii TaxID=3163343 RepID=A0ABV2TBY7_9BACT
MSVLALSSTPTAGVSGPDALLVNTAGLDLILPCWNPSDNWVNMLAQHYQEVQQLMEHVPIQLIVVNDGSTQNFTAAQIFQLETVIPGIIVVNYAANRGKGYAVREGVKMARYDLQVYTDLDFPFGVEAVKHAYDKLLSGADVVAGERGAAYLDRLPRKRRIITRISRMMNQYVLQLKVADAQAGLKGFNKYGKAVLLSTKIDGFLYDSEFMYRAGKSRQLRIAPVTVHCRAGIRFSSFKIKLLLKEFRNYLRIIAANQG